ncbi:RNA-binding transcriptional accessory protein [Muribaculaceae bacterium Isolate-104 (HZI)]|nr:RNA-binding transcriptional accessory protein [Muribaculaceae bacterium Isolate-104 (HZI)]
MPLDAAQVISDKLNIPRKQVAAVLRLFADGATIPFIARYRKEATGSLDEVALNSIRTNAVALDELEKRKEFIAGTLSMQGVLTEELALRLASSLDPAEIEDIYLPYRPRRRTRATAARENGLEPLARIVMAQKTADPLKAASHYVGGEVDSAEDAIAGASDIIAEWVSESEKSRNLVRSKFARSAQLTSKVVKGKEEAGDKYRSYFDFSKPLRLASSHNYLAVRRGEEEGFLKVAISIDDDEMVERLCRMFVRHGASEKCTDIVRDAVRDGYKRLLRPSIEAESAQAAKEKADAAAISVFADNVQQLLMAPPLGRKRVMAIDPGFKNGCKVACIDEQGALMATDVVYPCAPVNDMYGAADVLCTMVGRLGIDVIAVGDGTASRETMSFLRDVTFPRNVTTVLVSESGASIYSASETARREFPDLDITLRGAVSIGRRLLDPLAELVKIDPKSIGVGQYQHDVNQSALKDALDFTVEHCVNAVGVDVNTASVELLSKVSGIGPSLAGNIVEARTAKGRFGCRGDLLEVPRMGKKTFEQCAPFLRITGGSNPLDATGVHPERYQLVERMAGDCGVEPKDLIRNKAKLESLDLERYIDRYTGMPTLNDIVAELQRPARDPRVKEEETRIFDPDVAAIADLHIGLEIVGKVNNITAFGAFVDIGLKINGLVHISQLSEDFVSDPSGLVKVGQRVRVKVIDVDAQRGRVALSMRGVRQNDL